MNQEANFQAQLQDLNTQLAAREDETNKLTYQMEDVQRDLYIKSSGMDSKFRQKGQTLYFQTQK